MEVLNIYIKGQIGTSYDPQGNVITQGVEFKDVVSQVQENPEAGKFMIHIDSPGGLVETGNAIAEFISTLPNAYVIGSNLVASIATKIFVSVPVENRKIKEGTSFMIHNPFLAKTAGDADELSRQAGELKAMEKDLEKSYAKATGLGEEVISEMMRTETYLSASECVKLGFASEVIENPALQAVAILQTNNQMNTENKKPSFGERFMKAWSIVTGQEEGNTENVENSEGVERNAVAVDVSTKQGTLSTGFDDLQVNDTVTLNGEPASGEFEVTEGEYIYTNAEGETITLTAGAMITAADGVITSIEMESVPAENGEGKDKDEEEMNVENLQAQIDELKASLEASNTAKEEAEAKNEALEAEMKKIVEEVEAKAEIKSTFTPQAQATRFKKPEETITMKEQMEARRAKYSDKK